MKRVLILVLTVMLIFVLVILPSSHAQASPLSTFVVTNTQDNGSGSLRKAIKDANTAHGGTINFNIPGSGVHTIQPLKALPTLNGNITLDGYSQHGASANTFTVGDNAVLRIELDGSLAGSKAIGLNAYGGSSAGDVQTNIIRGIVVNRFGGDGILANCNNMISGNFIGTDSTGTAQFGNHGNGLDVVGGCGGGDHNSIGGATPDTRNVISGNKQNGVRLSLGGCGNPGCNDGLNSVAGNYIGIDATGQAALPNLGDGINSDEDENNASYNVISGNMGNGIFGGVISIFDHNLIGVNAAGTAALGNAQNGIEADGAGEILGNVISGNQKNGIEIDGPVNSLQANLIGTNAAGTAARGNHQNGIFINNTGNSSIGGTTAADANVISGNHGDGILISGSSATGNQILGNYIGTDKTGTLALGNNAFGVFLRDGAPKNHIGSNVANSGNHIAYNRAGIVVIGSSTVQNGLRRNLIYSNTNLGIDLGNNGVTANDATDSDTGPEQLQNFPVLTQATASTKTIAGSLTSNKNTKFFIEFFSSPSCDSTGKGEGQVFLGGVTVTTPANSNTVMFTTNVANAFAANSAITATATNVHGNTSEFSRCKTAS